jgi:hypothetical protein
VIYCLSNVLSLEVLNHSLEFTSFDSANADFSWKANSKEVKSSSAVQTSSGFGISDEEVKRLEKTSKEHEWYTKWKVQLGVQIWIISLGPEYEFGTYTDLKPKGKSSWYAWGLNIAY